LGERADEYTDDTRHLRFLYQVESTIEESGYANVGGGIGGEEGGCGVVGPAVAGSGFEGCAVEDCVEELTAFGVSAVVTYE